MHVVCPRKASNLTAKDYNLVVWHQDQSFQVAIFSFLFQMPTLFCKLGYFLSGGSRGGGGGAAGARPPKIGSTMFFFIPFCIRMLKNKAQIARESIKTPIIASRALRPALGPGGKGVWDLCTWCAWPHIIFCAPSKWKSWIRPCSILYLQYVTGSLLPSSSSWQIGHTSSSVISLCAIASRPSVCLYASPCATAFLAIRVAAARLRGSSRLASPRRMSLISRSTKPFWKDTKMENRRGICGRYFSYLEYYNDVQAPLVQFFFSIHLQWLMTSSFIIAQVLLILSSRHVHVGGGGVQAHKLGIFIFGGWLFTIHWLILQHWTGFYKYKDM